MSENLPEPLALWRRRLYKGFKELYQYRRLWKRHKQTILFVIGCQRSGTTLLTNVFHKDWNAKVFFENSRLSWDEGRDKLRLKPLPYVQETIDRQRFPLVVLKPLVESQNAVQLLDFFPNAVAVWMYRHYKDVAASNLRVFGLQNGINNLRFIVENRNDNWRAEYVPDWVREIVLAHFSETMNPYDAAALFWFVRNALYFDLELGSHPRVLACKYDDLALQPRQTMRKLYDFIHLPYPGHQIVDDIYASSVSKGQSVALSEPIEGLCEPLWNRLNRLSSRSSELGELTDAAPAREAQRERLDPV